MIRIIHIFKELLRNIFRNPGTTFSAILSMTLLLLLFDLFWIAAGTSDRFYDDLLSNINMELFINEEYPDSTLNILENNISTVPGVSELIYISKEDARNELSRLVGVDLLVGYDTANPLPRSYIISFQQNYLTTEKLSGIEKALVSLDGVSHVNYSKNWLDKTRDDAWWCYLTDCFVQLCQQYASNGSCACNRFLSDAFIGSRKVIFGDAFFNRGISDWRVFCRFRVAYYLLLERPY